MGAVTQLYRDIAAGKPGNLTHVGLNTFIDPRVDGGKLNELTKTEGDDLITLMNVDGKDYLFYRAFPINIAFLRGTTADPDGNITMEKESMVLEPLARKVHAIANYDNFNVSPHLVDEYVETVKYAAQFYENVTRYTTSTFLRMKLGDELQKRGALHIYESKEEARKALAAL